MQTSSPIPGPGGLASIRTLALLSLLAAAFAGCSSSEPTPVAFVAVGGNNHVLAIDLATGEPVRKVYSGPAPWRLVVDPHGRRLWVQHWYSGTTAVIGLDDLEIDDLLPYRGPGAFDGDRFVTFDWPEGTLRTVDASTLEVVDERDTGVREVYDLAPGPDGRSLMLAQFDPVSRGPVPRYGYVVSYDHLAADPASAHPASLSTGASPVDVVAVPGEPFLLTADRDTDGITLLNELGDRRGLAVCPGPRRIALSSDLRRMAVVCWQEGGRHGSEIVVFSSDFAARPWPELDPIASATLPAGLVAAAFGPDGERLYAVDRTGGRLLELDAPTLGVLRELAVGDAPTDVAVVPLPTRVVGRLREEEGTSRRRLRRALAAAGTGTARLSDLSWTETASWLVDSAEGEDPDESAPGDGAAAPAPVEAHRTLRVALHAPDAMRTEIEEGGVRLAARGHSVSLDRDCRFWVTPRQDLAATVYLLPSLSVDDAIRELAGDIPGSPFLRTGVAVDVVSEVERDGREVWVIGAHPEGDRVAQLWIDAGTGHPASLIEQFPIFGAVPHGGGAPEIAETRLYDYQSVAGRYPMPTRLERIVDGVWRQTVSLADFALDSGLPAERFDLAALGGAPPGPLFAEDGRAAGDDARPGHPVPVDHPPEPIMSPLAPHARYATSPPTSGPYLPYAADWGVHPVPVPLPLLVHSLLDGGVALLYHCPEGCPELEAQLAEVATHRDFVLVAPYPWMDAPLALAAWGRLETLDRFDADRVEAFLDAWAGHDHHADRVASARPVGAAP